MYQLSDERSLVPSPHWALRKLTIDLYYIMQDREKVSWGNVKPYKYEQPGDPKPESQHLPSDSTMKPDT